MNIKGNHITSVGNALIAPAQGGAILCNVVVNTAGSGAILKVYNAASAVTADLLAIIDCGTLGCYWYFFYCPKGIFYDLSVASADISIGIA